MKRIIWILAATGAALAVGCTPENDDAGSATPTPSPTSTPAAATLACASAAFGPNYTEAWRIELDLFAGAQQPLTFRKELAFEQDVFGFEPAEVATSGDGQVLAEVVELTFAEGYLSASESTIPGILTGLMGIGVDTHLSVVCHANNLDLEFAYDPATGACGDGNGLGGRNRVPALYLRETGNGQCAAVHEGHLNEENYGYPILRGWDLRGADLTGAALYFADLLEADLRGAVLDGFEYGYARIEGQIDAHTRLPAEGCEVGDGTVACLR